MKESLPKFPLPVVRDSPPGRRQRRVGRGLLLHVVRLSIFVALLCTLRSQSLRFHAQDRERDVRPVSLQQAKNVFASAAAIGDVDGRTGRQTVFDASGKTLGYVLQTSPDSDDIIGFSGSTDVLLAFDDSDRIAGVSILDSRDTLEHVALIERNPVFLSRWNGQSRDEATDLSAVDAVTGATLTSLAIAESIATRLLRNVPAAAPATAPPNLRFPEPPTVQEVTDWFPDAADIRWSAEHSGRYEVRSSAGRLLGQVFRTTPAADSVIGYQGPTDTLVGLSTDGHVVGLRVRSSFDNEPYVGYVRDDDYFLNLFNGKSVKELAALDLQEAAVEGVSGATMTSLAIAEGLVAAADDLSEQEAAPDTRDMVVEQTQTVDDVTGRTSAGLPGVRELSAIALLFFAALMGMTRLRGIRWLRQVHLVIVAAGLGYGCGALVSLATLAGWAQNGLPWKFALGLSLVTLTAVLVPALSRTQLYCHHVCPHGALQQLLRGRLRWSWQPRGRVRRVLLAVPFVLLIWALMVALLHWPFSLVNLEPFDAYVPRAAGWPTLTIFAVGLLVSLLTPMAYCRYGCPTGMILEFLRYHSSSDRWRRRDWMAVALLVLAGTVRLLPLPASPLEWKPERLMEELRSIAETSGAVLQLLAAGSVVMFVGSLAAVPWLIGLIPQDYFATSRPVRSQRRVRHPIVSAVGRLAKNLCGIVFLLAGLVMLVLPGQGVLVMLVGIVLLDFPGKRSLERRLVRRPRVLRTVNWIRRRQGKPELRVD